MDGDHFPLEMALVFYDGQFKSMTEVRLSENSDALAVISFLFEVIKIRKYLNYFARF